MAAFNAIFTTQEELYNFGEGIIILLPKTNPRTIADYRPITLLNTDYKILMKVLANRLKPLLPHLIEKEQICGVPGRNIFWNLSALRNIVEYLQAHPTEQAAILSLDFEKAFDRVNHSFLFMVLEKLNVPHFMISVIRKLYAVGRSKVQLNGYFTSSFPIKRGVRQGCPLSMLLFALSLEPFLRTIHNRMLELQPERLHFTVRAYADDVTVLLQYPEDEQIVVHTVKMHNLASGANLNYKKSSLLPLGAWQTEFSPSLFTVRDEVRILGIYFKSTLEGMLTRNWEQIVNSVRHVINKHKIRKLNLLQKIWHINTFFLSKIWYAASILPMPAKFSQQVEKSVGFYIWSGHVYRISRSQLRNKKGKGGQNLVDVAIKAQSLLIRRILLSMEGSGDVVDIQRWNNQHVDGPSVSGAYRCVFKGLKEFQQAELKPDSPRTSKIIYKVLRSRMTTTPSVQEKFPNRPWSRIWKNLNFPHVPTEWLVTSYMMVNDVIPTESKKHKHNMVDSPACGKCNRLDTIQHRLIGCQGTRTIWTWLKHQLCKFDMSTNPNDALRKILHFDFGSSENLETQLWLIHGVVHYVLSSEHPEIRELKRVLYDEKQSMLRVTPAKTWFLKLKDIELS